jgi:hypothetical protein
MLVIQAGYLRTELGLKASMYRCRKYPMYLIGNIYCNVGGPGGSGTSFFSEYFAFPQLLLLQM